MIFLRTSAADNNPAGASQFIAIAQPVGVQNGDLVLVGISLPAAGVTVKPPSADWTQVTQSDPAQALGIVAFWKVAVSEPARWVFTLSSSIQATGGTLVYGNTDPFAPVEVAAVALTAVSAAHAVAAATASVNGEELVLLLAAGAAGSYTPAAGFIAAVAHSQVGSTFEAHRRQLQAAAVLPASTVTFSTPTTGASLLIVLRPTPGTLSQADVLDRVVKALPRGADRIYDFTSTGDYFKFFSGIASTLKVFGFDMVDRIRAEIIPTLAQGKLPDWETIFGLLTTRTAQSGTVPQRQASVGAAWRAASGINASAPNVQTIVGPLLGYNPTTTLVAVEPDQERLRLAHAYGFAPDAIIAGAGTVTATIPVDDGGKLSKMGAQLTLVVSDPGALTTVTLTSPDGKSSATWNGPWTVAPVKLYAPSLAGARCLGTWTLSVVTNAAATVYASTSLYVEGVHDRSQYQIRPDEQPYQATGAAVFDWGVYADPAHLGENGTPPDFAAARLALARLADSVTVVDLIQSLAPQPDTDGGVAAAIPDECAPT